MRDIKYRISRKIFDLLKENENKSTVHKFIAKTKESVRESCAISSHHFQKMTRNDSEPITHRQL